MGSAAAPLSAEVETFYGLATPPTSYGGYGGTSQSRQEDGEHSWWQLQRQQRFARRQGARLSLPSHHLLPAAPSSPLRPCSQVHFPVPCRLEERDHQQARQGHPGGGLPGEAEPAGACADPVEARPQMRQPSPAACLHPLQPPPFPFSPTPSPARSTTPPTSLQQVFVITLGRAGEDNRSFRITNVDATLEGFAGADYDMLVGGGCVRGGGGGRVRGGGEVGYENWVAGAAGVPGEVGGGHRRAVHREVRQRAGPSCAGRPQALPLVPRRPGRRMRWAMR